MAAQQRGREVDEHALALVLGHANPTAMSNGCRQRQPAAGGGPLERRHIVRGLGQVPQPGQFAHVEQRRAAGRQGHQVAQVENLLAHPTRHELVASAQTERPVGGGEPVQSFVNRLRRSNGGRDDRQPQLDQAGSATEFFGHHPRVVQRRAPEPSAYPQSATGQHGQAADRGKHTCPVAMLPGTGDARAN